jgi:hypothetical protein
MGPEHLGVLCPPPFLGHGAGDVRCVTFPGLRGVSTMDAVHTIATSVAQCFSMEVA